MKPSRRWAQAGDPWTGGPPPPTPPPRAGQEDQGADRAWASGVAPAATAASASTRTLVQLGAHAHEVRRRFLQAVYIVGGYHRCVCRR